MLSDREKFLLYDKLKPFIHRYLIANSCNKLDGKAKSDNHVAISQILVDFIFCNHHTSHIPEVWRAVHSILKDVLTDRLDETIGFPIFKPLSIDTSPLCEKFFTIIVDNFNFIHSSAINSKI